MKPNQYEDSIWKNETKNAVRGTTSNLRQQATTRDTSVQDISNHSATKRNTSARGTANDAYRTLERHRKRIRRTSNRTTVSSYTGTTDKTNQYIFNAVSSVDRLNQQKPTPTFGERSAHPTWHSTRKSGYPLSRNNQARNKVFIVGFAVIFVAIIVFLVVAVRGCTG